MFSTEPHCGCCVPRCDVGPIHRADSERAQRCSSARTGRDECSRGSEEVNHSVGSRTYRRVVEMEVGHVAGELTDDTEKLVSRQAGQDRDNVPRALCAGSIMRVCRISCCGRSRASLGQGDGLDRKAAASIRRSTDASQCRAHSTAGLASRGKRAERGSVACVPDDASGRESRSPSGRSW